MYSLSQQIPAKFHPDRLRNLGKWRQKKPFSGRIVHIGARRCQCMGMAASNRVVNAAFVNALCIDAELAADLETSAAERGS